MAVRPPAPPRRRLGPPPPSTWWRSRWRSRFGARVNPPHLKSISSSRWSRWTSSEVGHAGVGEEHAEAGRPRGHDARPAADDTKAARRTPSPSTWWRSRWFGARVNPPHLKSISSSRRSSSRHFRIRCFRGEPRSGTITARSGTRSRSSPQRPPTARIARWESRCRPLSGRGGQGGFRAAS